MTSGANSGTDAWRRAAFWRAYLAVGVIVLLYQTLTVLTALKNEGPQTAWWYPVIDEYSSGLVILALFPLLWWVFDKVPPRRPWAGFIGAQVAAGLGYATLHIGGFICLRRLTFGLLRQPYRYGDRSDIFYEYRKDILAYLIIAGAIWAFRALLEPKPAGPEPLRTFDIRDGTRILRTPVSDILAATSAGNYVEVHLEDGRKPLMRATLASLESELAANGFVRTHRSWLVNPGHVRALEPEGSGDFRLVLSNGSTAPLSRRFPEAQAKLRGG